MSPPNYKSIVFLALVLFFTFVLTSCTDEALVDRSFITQEPCASPCWYGLELEQSSKDDVYAVLKELSFVDNNNIREVGAAWRDYENATTITSACLHPRKSRCVNFLLSDDRLKRMWISVNYELTFSTVVQMFGPPDYVAHLPKLSRSVDCAFSMYWPEKSFLIESHESKTCSGFDLSKDGKLRINPNMKVTSIIYMALDKFDSSNGRDEFLWPGFTEE